MEAKHKAHDLETAIGVKRPLQMTQRVEIVHAHLGTVRQMLAEGRDKEALLLLRGAMAAIEAEVGDTTTKEMNRMDWDYGPRPVTP